MASIKDRRRDWWDARARVQRISTERSMVVRASESMKWLTALALLLVAAPILAACGEAPASPTPIPAGIATASAPPAAIPTLTMISGPELTVKAAGAIPWSLVVVGDSVPYNSPEDCPGCTGFVDRYATAVTKATGHPVKVQNLSQHNNLGTDGLLKELQSDTVRRNALAGGDIIIVSIGFNDIAWNINDDPCDGPTTDNPDWSKFNPTCAAAAAEIFRPKLESVYSQIAALRAGKPTIFRTYNRYNDWIDVNFPPEGVKATHDLVEAWNAMACKAAQANGFTCADIYHAFNGSDGIAPAGDLLIGHPSDKGNEVIARVLAALGFVPTSAATNPSRAATASAQATEVSTSEKSVPSSAAMMQFTGHTGFVWQASFSPDGKKIVTASADDTVRIWDVASGKSLVTITGHSDAVRGVVFSPDGKTVLTASADQTARIWDAATGQELLRLTGHTDLVGKAVFSPDGKTVVTTSEDGTARVWDAETAKQRLVFKGHSDKVNRVAFSPDGKAVVTSSDDGTAIMWDPSTGKQLQVFKNHFVAIAGVAFSRDGKWLITASVDGAPRLWDVASGQELRGFIEASGVYGVAISPDGKYVATGGEGMVVRLWDAQTGSEVHRFPGHTAAVRNVVFSPDGKYILTASHDNTARLWLTP
jgi:WD40 repeat protein